MAITTNNPCYQCEYRRIGCHATCAQYTKWCKHQEEYKKMVVKMRGTPYYSRKGDF